MRRRVRACLAAGWFCLLISPGLVSATTLDDVVAQMQPGQWRELATTGFNNNLLVSPVNATHHALGWTEDMVWDPVSQQLLYLGGGHEANTMFIAYSAASNSWRRIALPANWVRTGPGGLTDHAYDHNAIVPSARRFYHRQFDQRWLDVYDIDSGAWSRTATMPGYAACCGALEYFPELGGLVYLDGAQALYLYNVGTNGWSTLSGSFSIGPYHNFAEYSPVAKVLVFGGGHDEVSSSRAVYRLDSNRNLTRLRDAPFALGTNLSITTVDPNSGRFLVFGANGGFYEFDALTDTWTAQPTPPFMSIGDYGVYGAVATPLASHGVIAVAKYNGDQSKVFLYKHSAGGAPSVTSLQFQSASYTVNENAGSVSISVTRTGSNAGAVSVSYATTDGSATAGTDYTAASGVLNWADGDMQSKAFTVSVIDDTDAESNETFNVQLSNQTNGAVLSAPNVAVATIVDNDGPATLRFSAGTYSVAEGDGNATIAVTRSGNSNGVATVNYTTASGSALAGADFTNASGTLTWNSGQLGTRSFSVPIIDDADVEGDETFTVTLSAPTGAVLGSPSQATVTIRDNDSPNGAPPPAEKKDLSGGGCALQAGRAFDPLFPLLVLLALLHMRRRWAAAQR